MLFNSYRFIFLFLPITLVNYFLLNKKFTITLGQWWLFIMSLVFYAHFEKKHIFIILASIVCNFIAGFLLSTIQKKSYKKVILASAISSNIFLLGYFKYANFFLVNLNNLVHTNYTVQELLLPLGISFFTFTQIAYLVDAYKQKISDHNFLYYGLFVTFFPHLLAGPILHHTQLIDQFKDIKKSILSYHNITMGLFLFTLGLSKKLLIADNFATICNTGFARDIPLSFIESWATSLSYTLQLYFDFSGYTDMALGVSRMFNITMPENFNSPYKAQNIQDFWRRWHITLSIFLRDYIYIPLGGSRHGEINTYCNLMITFLLGGFWHGAGWTFILWGFLHGIALVIHRIWQNISKKINIAIPSIVAWFITFNFVNIGWVFFRAKNVTSALQILTSMFLVNNSHDFYTIPASSFISPIIIIMIIIFIGICAITKNSGEFTQDFKPTLSYAFITALLLTLSILCFRSYSEFLYFRF